MTPATKTKPTIPLAIGQQLATKLIADLEGFCERIEIAGSIRRQTPEIGDVELVAIPKLGRDLFNEPDPKQNWLDDYLNAMIIAGKIFKTPSDGRIYTTAWGERYKKFWCKLNDELGELQVDLFLCTARNWGAIVTIRTGPADFSQALVTRIKQQTPYRQQKGYLVNPETGEVIGTPEERDYFRLAGVGWVEPERRSAQTLRASPKRAENGGVGKVGAPLSTRLKALLREQIRPSHKTAVRMRLRAKRDEFDAVVHSLKLLGEIVEDDVYRLHLVSENATHRNKQAAVAGGHNHEKTAPISSQKPIAISNRPTGNISRSNGRDGAQIVYTCDADVRAALQARLEVRAGIA